MELPVTFRKALVEFLTSLPAIHDPAAQRALIHSAAMDAGLVGKIGFGGPSEQFFNLLIPTLVSYGPLADGRDPLEALLAAANTQVGPGRQAEGDHLIAQWRACSQGSGAAANPYRGLSAFREEDERVFFGRDAHAAKLLEAAQRQRFVAVLGASGSGKSSLAQAGLLPKLRRQGGWQIAAFRPLTNPWHELAAALIPLRDPDSDATDRAEQIDKLTAKFAAGAVSVATTLKQIARNAADSRILLVIDQFEELYAPENAPVCARFIRALLDALTDASIPLTLVITLRSDFLGQTHSIPEFSHLIADHSLIVPAMSADELRLAIAEPAQQAGQPLSADVVDLLIEQTREREGALPLLEFALTRIWEGLSIGIDPADTLQQIGGVGGALAGVAQTLYDELSAADQQIARRAFLSMIRLGEGTRDTRRKVGLSEIVGHQDDPEQVYAVLRHFAHPNARLITLDADAAEITHEALFDHWDALKDWLDAGRDDLRFHRRLADAAQHWDASNRPDGLLWRSPDLELLQQHHQRNQQDMTALQVEFFQESKREQKRANLRKQITRGIWIALTLISILIALLAIDQRDKAKESEQRAVQSEQIAQQEREKAQLNEIEALNQTAKSLFASHDELNALLTAVKAGIKVKKIEGDVPIALSYRTGFNIENIVSKIEQKNRLEWFEGREECMLVTSISPNGLLAASTISTDSGKESVKLFDLSTKTFQILNTNSEQIKDISFSSDNRFFAVGEPKSVTIYTVDDMTKLRIFKGNFMGGGTCANDKQIEFSNDGRRLAIIGYKESETNSIGWDYQAAKIELWDIFSGTLIKTLDAFGIRSIKFSSNDQMLALSGCNEAKILRIADEYEIFSLKEPEISQERSPCMPAILSFSSDNRFFALGDRRGVIKIFDMKGTSPVKIEEWQAHSSGIGSLIFSSDNQWIISGSSDEIKIWEIGTWKVLKTLESALLIRDIGLNHNKTKLLTISNDGFVSRQCIEEWDITDKAFESVYFNLVSYFGNYASYPQFNEDGTMFAAGLSTKGKDKTTDEEKIHVGGFLIQKTGNKFKEITHVCTPLYSNSCATLNDETLITLFYNYDREKRARVADNLIITHNLKTSQRNEIELKGTFIDLSPKGSVVALKGNNDGNDIQLWSINDNKELAILKNAISYNDTGTVVVWSVSEEPSDRLEALDDFELSRKIAFSNNGTLLATSNNNTIKLWDVFTGKLIKTFTGHSDTIFTLTFASDDRVLVSGGNDRSIKLWDIQEGREILSLRTPSGIDNIAVSPNGKILVAKYVNRVMQLWDLEQKKEIVALPSTFVASPFIYWLRFTPDGKTLVLGGSIGINFFPLDILDDMHIHSCEWLQDYLHNPYANLSDADRALCDGILKDDD